LMTAFWVFWLTVTLAVPVPEMAALPPTTVPPSGLAVAEARPSGTRAVVANSSRRMADRPDALVPRRKDEKAAPAIAGTLDCLRGRDIGAPPIQPPEPNPAAGRACGNCRGRCPHRADSQCI